MTFGPRPLLSGREVTVLAFWLGILEMHGMGTTLQTPADVRMSALSNFWSGLLLSWPHVWLMLIACVL